ncbi:sugar phosphate nucleotidyltransferase [Ferruginibacter paludis]|uniref:sugar phosphate nucleotidyltransferase n=1 Tax=Ferruginibacter TaxID=1004303 RepID=UPI0025B4245F|nr:MULTISPECIES: sugar phosphate nucleotidyltransferase [Ferruginibacter]MDB5275319.1 glucose-phosphate thymidylyltransferase [Ferruginibacter sp.]MDN3657784.1 sugar phosphate nucleotidyltransferase [Ferruginibacter paludis]
MKAIIPVAGAGTKLRPHTYTQPKALIPLAGKTILSIIVDQLHEAGINDFIFIVGYLGEKIQDYVKAKYPHLNCHFVYQNERYGTGHAIDLAKEIIGSEEVFIVLGDTIAEYDIKQMLSSPYSMLGVKKVDDPRNFGVAEIEEDGFISRVVEKPAIPKSNMALVGIYKIMETDLLFTCLKKIIEKKDIARNDLSLTDALECMIQSGSTFKSFKVQNWFDCGKKETILESNATLLKKFGGKIPELDRYENTIIIPPVSIGEGCDIKNSVIGPNVTIGDSTLLNYTIVKDSIIGSFSKLYDVVLDDSLIGSDTGIKGETRSLNIGDNTDIDLG